MVAAITLMLTLGGGPLVGCAVYKKFRTPALAALVVEQVTVRLVEQSSEGASYRIEVTLQNPNDVDLPLRSAQYQLAVGETSSPTMSANPHRTLAANARQMVELTVALPQPPSGAWRCQGSITFEPPGEIRKIMTDSHVPLPSVNFTGEGTL